ncbi:MAG: hypothetical protein ACE5D7_04840, partial [Fidelibacterota bacterium]
MKSINLKLVVLWILVSYSLSQDTTYVDLPTAYVHFNYQNSTYGIGLGDESSLQLISGPAWTEVNFNLDTGNWLTYVDISGEPGLVHAGLNELMVGWYEWNFDTDEQELWHVYVFTLPVEYPGCSDPESCNFDPGMPEVENCLYIVYCFIDPCEVTACDYYPDAECVSDYCGGCYADFYVDGELVDCAVEPMEDIFLTWEYPDTVVTGSSANLMVLSLENSMAVGGLQFHVNIDPLDAVMITQIDPTERLGQLPVIWNYDESAGYYSLNVFDMINYIPPGEGAILEFYFDTVISDGFFEVTISEMNAGDYPNGDSLSV